MFITTERNIRYQQNLTGRTIAIVVLGKAERAASRGIASSDDAIAAST